jgi:hypothetical protein
MYTIYIGYDSSQDEAYDICKLSIRKFNKSIKIIPIMKKYLQKNDLYYRTDDQNSSTEFAYTRFLVPYLNKYQGWALFCDSDFLWRCNIEELFSNLDSNIALKCVQHDYTPKFNTKMNNKKQFIYPRKNWSSLMLFNCAHSSCKNLNIKNINSQSGAWLHQMQWCKDNEIQKLDPTYNYLVGYYNFPNPKAVHFTDGGPWHPGYEHVEFAEEWLSYRN